jgi:hypothetical protein
MSRRTKTPVYVVTPPPFFEGEVVKERDDAPVFFDERKRSPEARRQHGGLVKMENWFGDTESVWEVPLPGHRTERRPGGRRNARNDPVSCADEARRTHAGSRTPKQEL